MRMARNPKDHRKWILGMAGKLGILSNDVYEVYTLIFEHSHDGIIGGFRVYAVVIGTIKSDFLIGQEASVSVLDSISFMDFNFGMSGCI